jgi:hypothetical protein
MEACVNHNRFNAFRREGPCSFRRGPLPNRIVQALDQL